MWDCDRVVPLNLALLCPLCPLCCFLREEDGVGDYEDDSCCVLCVQKSVSEAFVWWCGRDVVKVRDVEFGFQLSVLTRTGEVPPLSSFIIWHCSPVRVKKFLVSPTKVLLEEYSIILNLCPEKAWNLWNVGDQQVNCRLGL